MKINELSKDKLDKLASFKTDEEIKAFVENEDIELDEEQLDAISGGGIWDEFKKSLKTCPYCGGKFASTALAIHEPLCPSNPKIIKPAEPTSLGTGTGMDMSKPAGLLDKIKEQLT
ncbi:MAG: C2HC-type zinc finger protein [Ruminococcus sp.]|nr:C2HC-type zinc finger protein [Ruminococcus sp.]